MAEERVQRRLAAILAADVVGYSRLMAADEVGTFDRLRALRREVFAPTIAEFDGRIFKITGDGALAEFASAANAVQSVAAVQRKLAEHNAASPDDGRIELRIGISLGDVIVEGGDLYGNGVNVAARMEGLAQPGGICISGNVYEHVGQSPELNFADLGDQTVKNTDRPVRCYRVELERSGPSQDDAPLTRFAAQPADKPSVAVLPFDNLSGDPEQEYFSDGLAEDLITDLSTISGLFVIARNSAFAFKGQPVDVRRVAEQLGVRHVLEGSVRKAGGKVRINAQLIDAHSGGHIWAERYDGNLEDIFSLQDNIAAQIVAALQVSLTPTDQALTDRKPTDSVAAHDLFLRGRASYHRYTPDDLREAIKCLEEAIEIDPNFAEAYSYLSYCHFQAWYQLGPEFDDNFARANELAEKGVALDGTSAIALTRLGWVQVMLRRYDESIANLEKAFALAPNNADVIATYGQILNYWGNPERGLQMMERAFSIEMIAPPNWEFQFGLSHLLLRQYDEALAGFNRAIERAPKWAPAYLYLAGAYAEVDRLDDARDAIKAVLDITPKFTVKEAARQYPHRLAEFRERILDSWRKAGLPEGWLSKIDAAFERRPAVLPCALRTGAVVTGRLPGRKSAAAGVPPAMADERVQRRLAAILIADVVGYSRLMAADEEGTRARLRALHADVIDANIAADGGRVVKTSGDDTLVEFPSAVDAVRNAVRTQAAIRAHNQDMPEDRRIVYRVGINVGDVIVEDTDIFGDGVNVASRLEARALRCWKAETPAPKSSRQTMCPALRSPWMMMLASVRFSQFRRFGDFKKHAVARAAGFREHFEQIVDECRGAHRAARDVYRDHILVAGAVGLAEPVHHFGAHRQVEVADYADLFGEGDKLERRGFVLLAVETDQRLEMMRPRGQKIADRLEGDFEFASFDQTGEPRHPFRGFVGHRRQGRRTAT